MSAPRAVVFHFLAANRLFIKMVQCKKCNLFLSIAKDDIIKCKGTCDSVFHKKCMIKDKAFMKSEVCEQCSKKETASLPGTPKLNVDLSKDSAEKVLLEVNAKLEVIYCMQKQISDMKDVVDFYSEKYQEMVNFKETAEKKIKSLENKNINLQKCNAALEERILSLETKETEKVIKIVGVKDGKNENTMNVVESIAGFLKISTGSIDEVKRVGQEKPDRPRTIVVCLNSKSARDEWITKRRTLIRNSDFFKNLNDQRIYINENLPKALRELFWNTKTMLKNKYKFMWVQNSRVLVKKEEKAKIFNIRNDNDLERLCKDMEVNANK